MSTLSQNKMGTAPMFPLIMKMALPSMFSMLIQSLYNIVDSYFVSQISTEAMAAVTLAFPIQTLIIAFSVGTAVGAGSLISRELGAGNQKTANLAVTHGLVFNIITWLLFLVFGLFFTRDFVLAFEQNETIVQMGQDYLSIVSVFSISIFISICFEKIFQSTGNMVIPMIVQLSGAIINIILDPILIFGYFGLPEMGVTGAAVATVIGQFIGAIIALYFAFSKRFKHEVSIDIKGFKFSADIFKRIYVVGLPTIVMNAVGTVMIMCLNGILAGFSAAAYTVLGIYFRLNSFVFMPVFGLSSGLMPIIGYNYGAKDKSRVVSCVKFGLLIALTINTLGMLGFMILPTELLNIFNADEEILSIGVPALRIISATFPSAAIVIVSSTFLQAVGKGTYSLWASLLRQLVLIVPAAYVLATVSLNAVWFAFPIAEVGSFVLSTILTLKVYREKIKTL